MKTNRNRWFIIAAVLLSVIAAIVIFYAQIATAVFSAVSGTDISYGHVTACCANELIFKDLTVIRRMDGLGISSAGGSVKFTLVTERLPVPAMDFALNDASFIKKGSQAQPSLNSLDGLVSAPFNSLFKYATVSGKINAIKNGIRIRDLLASGESIRFSFNGILTDDNMIDADITIYFADDLTGKMPPELTSMILNSASPGWKDISFKIQGDLVKPAINVTGKLFRLNIGLKSQKP